MTSDPPSYQVDLDVNITGFTGEELQGVATELMTERNIRLVLSWSPSAEGPESFRLIVEVAAAIGVARLASSFLTELGRDLYKWVKDRVQGLIASKHSPSGMIAMRYEDVEIYMLYGEGDEADFLLHMLDFATRPEIETRRRWRAVQNSNGVWELTGEGKKLPHNPTL